MNIPLLEGIIRNSGRVAIITIITSCSALNIEKTTTMQGSIVEQQDTTNPRMPIIDTRITEDTPFYTLEEITIMPTARTGTRGEIPIIAEEIIDEIEYETGMLIFGRKSITLSNGEYHVNIDIIENQITTLEGTYVLTFYKSEDNVQEKIPRIMYRIITNPEGEPTRANYQYFQQPTLKIEEDEETNNRTIEIVPTRIIIHQNPFNTAYGTNPEDGVVIFSVIENGENSTFSWKEEIFTPREEENPIPYEEAKRILEQEIKKLHITKESCIRALQIAQHILGDEWTLEEYLRRE